MAMVGTLEWAEDKTAEIKEKYCYYAYKSSVQDVTLSEYLGFENRNELLTELESVMDVVLEHCGSSDLRYRELVNLRDAIYNCIPI